MAKKSRRIGSYIFVGLLMLFLWLGLAAFVIAFNALGEKEGTDFIWQLVGFSFLLATLVYSVNASSLAPRLKKRLPHIGLSFILAGVFVIMGYGIVMLAIHAQPSITQSILKRMGQFSFLSATFFLSGGIALMTFGFLEEN